jgi:adenylate kinase
MIVVLIGPPGAGKSKQSQLLKNREHVIWVGAGQLLRETDNPKIEETMHKGELVDDATVNQLLASHIENIDPQKVIVLDGFPRHEAQARWLLDNPQISRQAIALVIHLFIPEDVTLKRLQARGRQDDIPGSIEERLNDYAQNIEPLVNFFAKQGIPVTKIDGNRSVEAVFADIDKEIHYVHKSQN